MRKTSILFAALVVCVWTGRSAAQEDAPAAPVNRPPCRKVLDEVNKEVNAREGRPASPRAVAHAMGIEPEWVLRCMDAYGRVPAERSRISAADREAFERALEEGRPVEVSDEQRELRYQKDEHLKVERQEMRQRRKQLEKEKEFDESADFTFPMDKY